MPAPRRRRDPLTVAAEPAPLGRPHRRDRERLLRTTPEGWPCPLCHQPMYPKSAPGDLHADHSAPRSLHPGSRADRLVHAECNMSRGNGTRPGAGRAIARRRSGGVAGVPVPRSATERSLLQVPAVTSVDW